MKPTGKNCNVCSKFIEYSDETGKRLGRTAHQCRVCDSPICGTCGEYDGDNEMNLICFGECYKNFKAKIAYEKKQATLKR